MGHWAQLGDTGTSLLGLHTQLLIHTSAQLPPPPLSSVQAQSCPTLCDLMNCSTPGFPVHHQLTELTQTHVQLSR